MSDCKELRVTEEDHKKSLSKCTKQEPSDGQCHKFPDPFLLPETSRLCSTVISNQIISLGLMTGDNVYIKLT